VGGKHRWVIPILLFIIMGVLAIDKFGTQRRAQPQTMARTVERLKPDGPGKSWRVEGVLGRDAAQLFVQGQGCYLSRTLGPR